MNKIEAFNNHATKHHKLVSISLKDILYETTLFIYQKYVPN